MANKEQTDFEKIAFDWYGSNMVSTKALADFARDQWMNGYAAGRAERIKRPEEGAEPCQK